MEPDRRSTEPENNTSSVAWILFFSPGAHLLRHVRTHTLTDIERTLDVLWDCLFYNGIDPLNHRSAFQMSCNQQDKCFRVQSWSCGFKSVSGKTGQYVIVVWYCFTKKFSILVKQLLWIWTDGCSVEYYMVVYGTLLNLNKAALCVISLRYPHGWRLCIRQHKKQVVRWLVMELL